MAKSPCMILPQRRVCAKLASAAQSIFLLPKRAPRFISNQARKAWGGVLECGEDRRFAIFFLRGAWAKKENPKAAILAALQDTAPRLPFRRSYSASPNLGGTGIS